MYGRSVASGRIVGASPWGRVRGRIGEVEDFHVKGRRTCGASLVLLLDVSVLECWLS